MSQSEWKRYYDTVGDIKAGTVAEYKVKGGRWIILNASENSNGTMTPARLILDNGAYISPKVKSVLTFATDDELYDAIDIWEQNYG